MSEIYNAISEIVESRLLELHTAFLAKVVAVNGKTYSIKPLAKYKQYGKEAQEYPVITNVYRCKGFATGKTETFAHSHTVTSITTSSYSHSHSVTGTANIGDNTYGVTGSTDGDTHSHTVPANTAETEGKELEVNVTVPIKEGDIVLCVALERDMSNLTGGNTGLPFTGVHHRINDAIIIDVVDL